MRTVVDTSALDSFLAAADTVAAGHADPMPAWAAYEQEHAEVFTAYLRSWGSPDRRPAATAAMTDTANRLRAADIDWGRLLEQVTVTLTPLVDGDVFVPVVVFVGMGTSNGWVTPLTGQQTVFIAAELVPDRTQGAVLAAHEVTHAVQHLVDPAWDDDDYPVGALTLAEGLATFVSTLAVPGLSDDEYLWFDTTHRPWFDECERVWPVAAVELRTVLDEPCGGPAESRFFALHSGRYEPGLPDRFGYYAGLRAVREATRTTSIKQLLAIDIPTASRLVRYHLDPRTQSSSS